MPISLRIRSMFWRSSVSSIPSTTILPRSWRSSRLSVRMNVDFPDPDGPTITTTSPRRTVVEIPLSAWNPPNHFSTSSASIMTSPSAGAGMASSFAVALTASSSVGTLIAHPRPAASRPAGSIATS